MDLGSGGCKITLHKKSAVATQPMNYRVLILGSGYLLLLHSPYNQMLTSTDRQTPKPNNSVVVSTFLSNGRSCALPNRQ